MKPIKYIKSRHEHERITKWRDKTKEKNLPKGLTKIQGQYN